LFDINPVCNTILQLFHRIVSSVLAAHFKLLGLPQDLIMANPLQLKVVYLSIFFCYLAMLPASLLAHCQIPCGIYDDHARIKAMLEDVDTVAKATAKIGDLHREKGAQSHNQLVRWINNKEIHAENIISTISDYFLTQRVKTSQKDYTERLAKHHAVMIAAMKVKQNANKALVKKLRDSIMALDAYYPKHQH